MKVYVPYGTLSILIKEDRRRPVWGAIKTRGLFMSYTVTLYDPRNGGRYFWERYLYYTKKEVRQLARKAHPGCKIQAITRTSFL